MHNTFTIVELYWLDLVHNMHIMVYMNEWHVMALNLCMNHFSLLTIFMGNV